MIFIFVIYFSCHISLLRNYLGPRRLCDFWCVLWLMVLMIEPRSNGAVAMDRGTRLFLGLQLGQHSLSLPFAFTKPTYLLMTSAGFHNQLHGSRSSTKILLLVHFFYVIIAEGEYDQGTFYCVILLMSCYNFLYYLCQIVIAS